MATGSRQDGRHGDAHRLADAQQARQPAGRPLLRRLPHRHARHHHPRPPARAAAERPGELLPRSATSCPPHLLDQLGQAKIVITNFHAFKLREKVAAGKLTKSILAEGHDRARSPRRPTRWSAASAASWAPRRTSSSSTTRPTTATAANRTARTRSSPATTARRPSSARGRGPRLDLRPRGGQGQDRRQGDLRPVGHAVLPARLGLPRGHALPVGRLRLLADRRHRVRHRQGAPRAGRRRLDDRRAADLPRPVAPHPRRPAQEGPQDRGRRRRAQAPRRAARGAAQPLRQLRAVLTACGSRTPRPAPAASRRRSSSSSATTPTSPSWSSTTSPAGKSRSADGRPSSRPGNCPSSATTTATALAAPPEHDPGRQPSSSNPARR